LNSVVGRAMGATYTAVSLGGFGPGADIGKRPIVLALAGAALLHALLLFGVGFAMPEPRPSNARNIEVMLVTQTGPMVLSPDADSAKAQADRAGETLIPLPELDEPRRDPFVDNDGTPLEDAPQTEPAPEPLPMSEPQAVPRIDPAPEPAPEPEPVPESEQEPPPPDVLSAEQSPLAIKTPPMASAADILGSRNDEIARLTARINAQTQASRNRARRKAISTSTREYRYASYMEAWRRKVERIGNLNYPAEAREQGLSGNLILHVAVRADGSLEGIRVVRSSGHKVLDQAAIHIVELAAPFAEFPADIASETDVLDITRTWQFQRNNRLGWDH